MVNEAFTGFQMGAFTADKFAAQHIDPAVLAEESDLMEKKFWDYKLWHPTVATMYFISRYNTIAANIIKREVGEEEAKEFRRRASYWNPAHKQNTTVIRGFWRARQAADGIGCTYDVYIRAAIRVFRANIKLMATKKANKDQQLPYPQQLYTTFILEEAIKDWSKDKIVRFPLPQSDLIPNNRDLWFRPEMEAWLIEEASRHPAGNAWLRDARAAGIIMEPA